MRSFVSEMRSQHGHATTSADILLLLLRGTLSTMAECTADTVGESGRRGGGASLFSFLFSLFSFLVSFSSFALLLSFPLDTAHGVAWVSLHACGQGWIAKPYHGC